MIAVRRNCKVCKRKKVPVSEWWESPYNACTKCIRTRRNEVMNIGRGKSGEAKRYNKYGDK